MTTETHTLVDCDYSLLCRQCQKLPPVDENDELVHEIHDNLDDLESCSCPFCRWLWDAICAEVSSESVEIYKRTSSSSVWPIELTMQLRNGQSKAWLGVLENTILMLPMYTSPGMFSLLIERQGVLGGIT